MRLTQEHQELEIPLNGITLLADLTLPQSAKAIIVFVHGSGSSRLSSRNRYVATVLAKAGFATLLMDLLTQEEESIDNITAELRFNIPFLTERVLAVTHWLQENPATQKLHIAYFGASTGAAAALRAAAQSPHKIFAVVSRGGRPDLALDDLPLVQAPTLLIVGGDDEPVIGMNQEAARHLKAPHQLTIIPGATHLFEEPGKLEKVAELARDWFLKHEKLT